MQPLSIENQPRLVETVTGVVLAGGKSTRMGRDKATLELGGQTLRERCATVLRACFAEVLVITQDDVPGLGPIGGLLTGLRRVKTPALFLAACDMPFLDAKFIRRMAGELAGYDAVAVPGEPLHAVYATRILPVVEEQIATGEYSMNKLLARLRVNWISDTGLSKALRNVNIPQEWEAAKQHGQ